VCRTGVATLGADKLIMETASLLGRFCPVLSPITCSSSGECATWMEPE
jgi:hypothetical protein